MPFLFAKSQARRALRIGLPIFVAQLSQIGMNFADTIMSGHYSAEAMAAVAVGCFPEDITPVLGLYPLFFAMAFQWNSFSGADGFVIGCLTAEGELDGKAMEPLREAAEGCGLTLHRCIDVSRNLENTYRNAARLGFDTVLTSGGAGECPGP